MTTQRHAVALFVLVTSCSDPPEAGSVASTRVATELDVAWSEFATCLIGEPLVEGERASARLSAIDLSLLRGSLADPPRRSDEWPQRCNSLLAKAGSTAPEIEASALRDAARRFVALGLSNMLAKSMRPSKSNAIDELFAAAKTSKVVHEATGTVPHPPLPTKAPAPFKPFWNGAYATLTRPFIPDDRFMLVGGGHAAFCRPQAPDKVTCRDLEGRWGDRAAPVSRSPAAARDLFVDRTFGELRGVFDAERYLVAAPPFGPTAFLSDDGTLTDVVRSAGKSELLRVVDASLGAIERHPIAEPKDTRGRTLLGDVVVSWAQPTEDRIVVSVSPVEGAMSASTTLGELEGASVEVRRRRGETCDALFFVSREEGWRRKYSLAVSLRTTSGSWSPLVKHAFESEAIGSPIDSDDGSTLECVDGFASLRVGLGLSLRCDTSGCKEERRALPSAMSGRSVVLRLGDKMLAVGSWAGATTLHDTASVIQYRFGRSDELGSAPDQLLAVGEAYGGSTPSFGSPTGFVHEGRAYVFFGGRGGDNEAYGISFGEDGVPTPILP